MVPPASTLLGRLRQRACADASHVRVVLAESDDARVLEAAIEAQTREICQPILIGEPEAVRTRADGLDLDLPDPVIIVDPAAHERIATWATEAAAERAERGLAPAGPDTDPFESWARRPLPFAGLLVRHGEADAAVLGAVATTADTLRAALRTVGVHPESELVSSCFLMELPDGRVLVFADCGVVPRPTPLQLADIAVQTAATCRRLLGEEPRVALLSFSTLGSARHADVDRVIEAGDLLAARAVDFEFAGELQADAALVPAVAARKAPESKVAGHANVMIFPDLTSGNIAYKLTERLAGARAVGPLLQGLARPIHDLSRGCSASDIVDAMAIAALDVVRSPRRVA
ncbi:MAG: phosphate acetyltransferase [Acidobacteriota bacterium]